MRRVSDRIVALKPDPERVDRLHRIRADRHWHLIDSLAARVHGVIVTVTIGGEGSEINTTLGDVWRLDATAHETNPRTISESTICVRSDRKSTGNFSTRSST